MTQMLYKKTVDTNISVDCSIQIVCQKSMKLTKVVKKAKGLFEDNPWTIYFLIDVQLVFIFTHMYASAINLISTTANAEATKDRQSGKLFNVTKIHQNVNVTKIDDAVLWNCREHSVTKGYYAVLYWMSIIALIVGLTIVFLTKVLTFAQIRCKFNKHILTKVWHIALFSYLKAGQPYAKNTETKKTDDEQISGAGTTVQISVPPEKAIKLLCEEVPDKVKLSSNDTIWKTISIPCWLTFLMVSIMLFFLLSYDIHPLACIAEPGIDTIGYKFVNASVNIRYPNSILIFQKVAFGIVISLTFLYLMSAMHFYHLTCEIKDHMLNKYGYLMIEKEVTHQDTRL